MPENNLKERFKNVDFLRFILAVIIVMYHGKASEFMKLSSFYPALSHGYFCVEFFFIVSGFFLFKNINKNEDTVIFAKKKYFRLIPAILLLLLFTAITSIFITEIHFNFNENIMKLFLLQTCGLSKFAGETAGRGNWFVSVLFCSSIFYFYLYKITSQKWFNFITALLILFGYTIFLNFKGNNHWGLYNGFLNTGLVRGIAGLGIGYFIAMLYNNKFLKTCTTKTQIIISGLEIYLSSFLTYYLLFTSKVPGKTNFLFILTFCILFYCFLIKQGILSKFLDKGIFGSLGQYSYTIYIMQFLIMEILKYTVYNHNITFIKGHTSLVFTLQTIIVVLGGIIIYQFFEKPINRFIKKKFLQPAQSTIEMQK